MKNNAYITYLSTNNYYKGVIALKRSLDKVDSKYDLYCMCTKNISNRIKSDVFPYENIKIIEIDNINVNKSIKNTVKNIAVSHWNNCWYKLRVFGLNQFDRVVFIDADIIVVKNIDHLFDYDNYFIAPNDGNCIFSDNKGFCAGLMSFSPSKKLYNSIIKYINDNEFGEEETEQKILNKFFGNNVFMLDDRYNMFAYYVNQYSKEVQNNVKVIHYIGKSKPFNMNNEEINSLKDKNIIKLYNDYKKYLSFLPELYYKKLSILVPRYKENEEIMQYLLDSIKIQQGINFKDIEVIIGQDGLENGIEPLNDDFIDYYKDFFDIKYIIFEHGGVSTTRNNLMKESSGEYIQFCDSDDMFSSNLGIRLILQEIDNKHFDILYSSFTEECFNKEKNRTDFYIHNNDSTFVHGKIINRDFIDRNNIKWNDKLTLHEDSYFFALCYHLADKNKIDIIDKPFYLWKWRSDSVVRSDDEFLIKSYTNLLDSNEELIKEFLNRNMSHQASMFTFLATFNLYYNINKDEYMKEKNEELVKIIEIRFKDFYNKYVDLMDNLTAEKQLSLIKQVRDNAFNEGLILEHISFNDWIKRVLER